MLRRFNIVGKSPADTRSSGGERRLDDDPTLRLGTVPFLLGGTIRRLRFFGASAGMPGVSIQSAILLVHWRRQPADTDRLPMHPNHLQWYSGP